MNYLRYQLTCIILLLVAGACSTAVAQDFTDLPRIDQSRFSRVSGGDVRRTRQLPASLKQLQVKSKRSVEAILDEQNKIVSVDLEITPGAGRATSHEQAARTFLKTNLPLLVANVVESELRLVKFPYGCETAPAFGGKKGSTLVFQRVINNLPVVGGSITLQVDGNGSVVHINNSLAPVSRNILSADSRGLRNIGALEKAKRPTFESLVANARERSAIIKRGKAVFVPVRGHAIGGLLKATHITWTSKSRELMSGFLLSDGTILTPAVIPASRSDKSIPLVHLDDRTKLPTFISYRPRGGLTVSAVGVFNNPAEIAFRYLEENPNVFRTGAARCQFEVDDIRKSSSDPQTTFVKLRQVMAGRRVFGAELVFEIERGNRIQTIQGHTIAHVVALVPRISTATAQATALQVLDASLTNMPVVARNGIRQRGITSELVVFPGELVSQKGMAKHPPTRLAYHTQSFLHGLFIDAISGDVLYGYSLMPNANIVREAAGRTILDKPSFTEVSRDAVPTNPGTALSPDAALAVPLLTATDAFYRAHGWIGTNGSGGDMVVNVNVNLFTCPNAFSPPIDEESYYCTGLVVPDVVGHELTHGVIWNSSNLIYADEPGALNESYADIIGNLAFPDVIPAGAPAGTLPGWLVGETAAATGFTVRNMANPAASTPVAQPINYAGYVSRTALGCLPIDPAGLLCDFGGVHTNSGITNLAHVLMSDGGVGGLVGMGRARLRVLVFDVMTLRLSSWSRMADSALATKASCDAILARGGTDLAGVPFTQLNCDQIPGAYATVGIDPNLLSNWVPPTVGFAGTIVMNAGEPTQNACTITDLILQMDTPGGPVDSQASLLAAGTALTTSYFGLLTATIATTAPPIGTAIQTHTITWTNAFGESPSINSVIIAPPPPGASNCRAGGLVTETKTSAIAVSPGIPLVGGAGTLATGNPASTMNAACVLVRTDVEIVNGAGTTIGNTGATSTWSDVVWIAFVPVTLTRTATVTAQPAGATPGGPTTFNLSAPVAWAYSAGLSDVRWRLVYTIDKPAGVTCTP